MDYMLMKPVVFVNLVSWKDSEDGPALELFKRRKTVIECFENSPFTSFIPLHAPHFLLVQTTSRSSADGSSLGGALPSTGAVSDTHNI